jgi:hypothetical protein
MIAFIIWKIIKGLLHAMESVESSQHVIQPARKMYMRFEEQWGCGDPGTVATEPLTEGPRRRPKGIPKLALVASFLDPRFKFRPGFSDHDKQYIWDIIRRMMTIVALAEHAEQETIQGDQEQHLQPYRQLANPVDTMFLELNQMAQEHLAVNGDEQNDAIGHNDNIHREDAVNRVDAELLLYKREQHLPLQKDDAIPIIG